MPSLRLEPGEYGDDMSSVSLTISKFASLPFCPAVEMFLFCDDLAAFVGVDLGNKFGSVGLSFARCLV